MLSVEVARPGTRRAGIRRDRAMPADERPPVSCYIRTFDEEARIGATVRAALAAAREVVVVDSGSGDGTVAVAEAAGARVISHEWIGYGHQKRIAEEACRHDWLLDLDADEVVTDGLATEIRALFADGAPGAAVYRVRLRYVDPSGRVWRKARAPRRNKLYDRRKVRQPAHGAWDQFQIPAGVRTGELREPLLHYTFDSVMQLARKQMDAETRIARALNIDRVPGVALKMYFGLPFFFIRSYLLRGRWREGRYGFLFAVITAYSHWYRYAVLHARKRRKSK